MQPPDRKFACRECGLEFHGAIQYVQHLDGARHRKTLQAKLAQAKAAAGNEAEAESEANGTASGPAAQPLVEPKTKDSILRCQPCGIAHFTSHKSKLEHWETPEHKANDNGSGRPKKKAKHSKE